MVVKILVGVVCRYQAEIMFCSEQVMKRMSLFG